MPLLALLTPFFFVVTGSKIDLHEFASIDGAVDAGGGHRDRGHLQIHRRLARGDCRWDQHSATIVGVGMVPRGEVGIVVATLGLAAGVFNNRIYAIIVAMSLLTSVVTPPVLAWLLKRPDARGHGDNSDGQPGIDAPT